MGEWTDVGSGSIYYALGKLAEEGHIERVATQQEGNRPSRTVYRITDFGGKAFLQLLREARPRIERQTYAQDLALFFLDALPPEEAIAALRDRVTQLKAVFEHLAEHRAGTLSQPGVPVATAAIFDHSQAHVTAELAWTEQPLDCPQDGTLGH